jgi:Putative peptidoglycan binding domain
MTSPPWPSIRAAAPPTPLFAAVVMAALLLCLPASSFAGADRASTSQTERGESSATALASAGVLARGSGYGNRAGSKAVRELQLRLRRLGHRPGPIDGLFGPLTQASVERFQRRRALLVDGVVGPRTRARLLALAPRRPARRHDSPGREPGAPDRLAPSPPAPANVAPQRDLAPDAGAARPAAREPNSSDGLDPWLAALLGALAMGVLLAGVSRLGRPPRGEPASDRRGRASRSPRSGLNVGMACAVLLAVFAVGAAVGALFATHAAPDERDGAEVASGALLSPPKASRLRDTKPAEAPRRSRPAVAARQRPRPHRSGGTTPAPIPRPATAELPGSGGVPGPGASTQGDAAPAPATAPPIAPVEDSGGTYTERSGDSPGTSNTGQLVAGSSEAAVAHRVKRLLELNLEDRITPGDSDLLTAGEQLRRP